MLLRSWIVLISCILLFLGCATYAWIVHAQQSPPSIVDLTKDEAITLLKLQYQVESAFQSRDRYVTQLYDKYKLSQITHQLDVASGKFIPKPEPKGK